MSLPDTDAERFALIETQLYTPVLGDVLDGLGRVHQFLPQPIQPIRTDMRLAGRAMPVLCADVFGPQRHPFGRLTEALDALAPGEVFLGRTAKAECALWGEITTATAKARGAAGAVIDGFHRDTPNVLEQDWPVFSRGRYAQDSGNRSIVLDFGVPIEVDGVAVRPGDLVVGDLDGVLVIPAELENEVLERALEKAVAENAVRKAIEAGMSSTEAFRTYGVL
jgi:4-hydroxy-4-methyl-2-oxoglutarate aldolase